MDWLNLQHTVLYKLTNRLPMITLNRTNHHPTSCKFNEFERVYPAPRWSPEFLDSPPRHVLAYSKTLTRWISDRPYTTYITID